MARKMNTVRRTILVRMIPKKGARLVTFSKRKATIFKKANELCTLTGAEIFVIVFSPCKKPYSFGHPSVTTITNRFLNQRSMQVYHYQNLSVADLNRRYHDLREQLEEEKKKQNERLKQMEIERQKHSWLGRSFEDLNWNQLMISKKVTNDLFDKVIVYVKKLSNEGCSTIRHSSADFVGSIDLNVVNLDETKPYIHL